MMNAIDLADWIARRKLTQAEAAQMLGLSRRGLQDQLYGIHPVSDQTAQLCDLWDAYDAINQEEPT